MKAKKKVCKWYQLCPIKYFVEQGKLDRKWINEYCLIDNKKCIRYQLEESGKYHPCNMLPNGEIMEELDY
ncbi:MAG: uracil-DNA glycosylase [Candidatus Lokiarchaeota archaeon]|nr:uracil-DNA glycosylase [Candidatus Lokiarchaeota archaeon]